MRPEQRDLVRHREHGQALLNRHMATLLRDGEVLVVLRTRQRCMTQEAGTDRHRADGPGCGL